jgi:putative hydrolase of the HAD superfamily
MSVIAAESGEPEVKRKSAGGSRALGIRALVFDLDDTLYPEIDFVSGGYRAVARFVSDRYGRNCTEIFYTMMATLAREGRGAVIPTVLERFCDSSVSLQEIVGIYRRHLPRIRMFPGYGCLLRRLGRNYRLGILTDGNPEAQRRKVEALGLDHAVDKIIYTWDYGEEIGKPHPLTFLLMLDYLRAEPPSALYVGDNPDKDCRGAHGAGMLFAQLRVSWLHGNGTTLQELQKPEFVIDSLYQLPSILESAGADETP